jgi:hypothetical protein
MKCLSIDGAETSEMLYGFKVTFRRHFNYEKRIFSKTFDAELMLRTVAVHLACFENNFSEIDF